MRSFNFRNITYGLCLFFALAFWSDLGLCTTGMTLREEIGGKGSGPGQFGKEIYVTFDRKDGVYISDSDHLRVQRITEPFMEISSRKGGFTFNHPKDMAVDGEGRIYVIDWKSIYVEGTESPRIFRLTPCVHVFSGDGGYIRTVLIPPAEEERYQMREASMVVDEKGGYAVAVEDRFYDGDYRIDTAYGTIFILDVGRNKVLKFDSNGNYLSQFASYGSGPGQVDSPGDIAADNDGYLYIADSGNNRVVKFDQDGNFILSFGREGLDSGEVIEPYFVSVLSDGNIAIADQGEFERKFKEHPFSAEKGRVNPDWLDSAILGELTDSESMLEQRISDLEEKLYDRDNVWMSADEGEDNKSEEEESEEFPEKYVKVFRRVQIFSPEGKLIDKINLKMDMNDEELHDLSFLSMDYLGHVYLLDQDRHRIRKYSLQGYFLPQWKDVEKVYAIRFINDRNLFREDYGDKDTDLDDESRENHFDLKQALSVNYDVTEMSRISLEDFNIYSGRDDKDLDFDRPASDYKMKERGIENSFKIDYRYLLNPNPYRYREINIFGRRLDGLTTYRGRSINEDLNKAKTDRDGDASALIFGIDFDLTRDSNVSLGYSRVSPERTSGNLETYLYDTDGRLYRINRHYDSSSTIVGEFKIKF